jgi:CheY-like chemotaxis protein
LAAELDEGIIYGQGELLILADDDEFVRESHRDALVQLGYRVLSAADGQQALDMYQDCPQVALVICDVVMPNLDGMTAGRKMRDINADLPLLYMSGYADKTEKHGNLPEGAEILNKPASIELLSRKVAKLLHHR